MGGKHSVAEIAVLSSSSEGAGDQHEQLALFWGAK